MTRQEETDVQAKRKVSRRMVTSPLIVFVLAAAQGLSGCKSKETGPEAPPSQPEVVSSGGNTVRVSNPQRFPLTSTSLRSVTSTLNVTGSVSPDVSREIPVLSLANGRVVSLHVGLGDMVRKGQLVMEVQSPDVSTAFSGYLKAVSDEHLARITLDRDKLLFDKGAIPQTQLEGAENGEEDAKTALTASEQQLKILGVDKSQPGETVKIYAPASGIVISQNVTAAGVAGVNFAGSAGSLTIADLSHVWVVCDVYENDLQTVHLGQHADIRLAAFPGRTFSGTISDIGALLDPSIRTAKVRIQVQNPDGALRIGMFATAILTGSQSKQVITVPTTAILQLHDRSYVFLPGTSSGEFRRTEIKMGRTLDGSAVEVQTGLATGQQIVTNALDLQNTADQE